MNGTVAQIAALACHLNAVVRGVSVEPFLVSSSTAVHCERIQFTGRKERWFGPPKEVVLALDPDAWCTALRVRGATGCRLLHTARQRQGRAEWELAGFNGVGDRSLEVAYANGSCEWWAGHWDTGTQGAADGRVWRVTYNRIGRGSTVAALPIELGSVVARLGAALEEAHTFATTHADALSFSAVFEAALDALRGQGAQEQKYRIAPPGLLAVPALSLLEAAQRAWVFGGMGCWNDLGFDGAAQVAYERVSEQLYDAVCSAIVEAVNAGAA